MWIQNESPCAGVQIAVVWWREVKFALLDCEVAAAGETEEGRIAGWREFSLRRVWVRLLEAVVCFDFSSTCRIVSHLPQSDWTLVGRRLSPLAYVARRSDGGFWIVGRLRGDTPHHGSCVLSGPCVTPVDRDPSVQPSSSCFLIYNRLTCMKRM